MLFVSMSKKGIYYLLGSILLILSLVRFLFISEKQQSISPERVKVALREVGNQLLLAHKDATSLILPVTMVAPNTFQLSFESVLAFDPEDLDAIMKQQLEKVALTSNYLVEVIDCTEQQVVYSYYREPTTNNNMIPCIGRALPEKCYLIEIQFTQKVAISPTQKTTALFLAIIGILFLTIGYYKSEKAILNKTKVTDNAISIGHFKFYPEENKLIKETIEIQLSKKECEILAIFIANPNQVIKRDELTKRVWEDHGVIVGRSLDTYISKLRKILKDDTNIKLTNVHGVGYKLEVKNHLS